MILYKIILFSGICLIAGFIAGAWYHSLKDLKPENTKKIAKYIRENGL